MTTEAIIPVLTTLFSELTTGAPQGGGAYVLNSGDVGLLRSLDKLGADEASATSRRGATIAAHVQHLRYGLSLMNRWATEGGNPFADARWEDAWGTTTVSEGEWAAIRAGLAEEVRRWHEVLATPREVVALELNGMFGSVVHLAYHLGAIRQIAKSARGPREGEYR